MSLATFPKRVLFNQIAESGLSWSGDLSLDNFQRLAKEAVQETSINQSENAIFVMIEVSADKRNQQMFRLKIDSTGQLPLQCQRCLQTFMQSICVNTEITLLESSSCENLLYENEDFLVLEDLSIYSHKHGLSLLELIEDELLLSIPISPKHEVCDMSVQSVGVIPDTTAEDDNPFSVLAGLKGKLNR